MPLTASSTDTTPKRRKKAATRLCTFEGCTNAAKRKGVCMDHGGRHICKVEHCQKCAHKGGFCIGHGGGRRCSVDGCGKSAQAGGTCYSHGGGKHGSRIYCKWEGCQKCAHKGGFCIAHGGGRRCDVQGCTRSAQVGGSCYSHGGGKRCRVNGCNHAGRLSGLCIRHKKVSDMDSLGANLVNGEPMARPIFVDWSPRAFAHVLKGLRTQSFHFVDKLAAADRDEVLDALAYLKLDVTQCGYTAPNDDAKVGEPMVCPSKRRATERFEEMPAVGDPESGTRFSTTPPPDAIARKHKARARLEEAVRLEKQARKLRKKAHINYDDNLD
ncbi:hypothetical protein DYB32_000491 [Aphanomyces invadans]|uniref:WRKY19-like zinc finger domain-containing protein n=1 Tax=Aphanomyces invadans TaxID=157072 RepID=A0A418B9U8_9STRA|nr:hypothetical protein DYB32_000491 [Aphanomyces invadans]